MMFLEIFPPYFFLRQSERDSVDLYQVVDGCVVGISHSLSLFTCLSISDNGEELIAIDRLNSRVEVLHHGKLYRQRIRVGDYVGIAPIASSPPMFIARDRRRRTYLYVFDEDSGIFVARETSGVPIYPNSYQSGIVNQGYIWEIVEGKDNEPVQAALLKVSSGLEIVKLLPTGKNTIYTRATRGVSQWVSTESENGVVVRRLWLVPQQNVVTITHKNHSAIWFAQVGKSGLIVWVSVPADGHSCSFIAFYSYGQEHPDWIIPADPSPSTTPCLDGRFLYVFDSEKRTCMCWDAHYGYVATIELSTLRRYADEEANMVSDLCKEARQGQERTRKLTETLCSVSYFVARKRAKCVQWDIDVKWNTEISGGL